MDRPPLIFDRAGVRRNRARAAAGGGADFLFREAAARLLDHFADIRRPFGTVIDLASRGGFTLAPLAARAGTETVVALAPHASGGDGGGAIRTVVGDEEWLPFGPACADAVVSCLALHWANDLPGVLAQVRSALRPDGLLLASLFGAGTLHELRRALLEAESEETGGASPRVAPFVDVRDAGALLQRAGFAMPVVDAETITVTYPDALALMRDLRAMGEANALAARVRRFTRRGVMLRAAARYAARHAGADGRIPATFQIVTLTAWAPHASQPRPLRPGSAAARLADALQAEEKPAGDKAGR